MSMFSRIFSSASPKRPPPPDPTPKWKEEIQNLENSISILRNTFQQTQPHNSTSPKGKSSSSIININNNNNGNTSSNEIEGSAPTSTAAQNVNHYFSLFESIPQLLTLISSSENKSDSEQEQATSDDEVLNNNNNVDHSKIKPLALFIAHQCHDLKTKLLEQVVPQMEQNSKNLKDQLESIAVAFTDAHELKYVREELQASHKRNEGLEHEIETARQTVVELMSKISKLNPKAAKELKVLSEQESAPSSSPSPNRSNSNNNISIEFETVSCQVSFPETSTDDYPSDIQQLQQRLADAEFLLSEVNRGEKKPSSNAINGTASNEISSKLVRTESEVLRWKSLVDEERKILESLRHSHAESETQLRSRYETEISNLKKEFQHELAQKRFQWEQQVSDANRKVLFQKEDASRYRLVVDECDERNAFLMAEHVALHVGDARAKIVAAKKESEIAVQERNEFDNHAKELQTVKEKLEKELAENTRAMMLLQGGEAKNDSFSKSPSKSRFFGL